MNIGIYLYDNAEVLDFSGPFEVFSTAQRLSAIKNKMNVFLVGEKDQDINARGGFSVNPAHHFLNHPHIDMSCEQINVMFLQGKESLFTSWPSGFVLCDNG